MWGRINTSRSPLSPSAHQLVCQALPMVPFRSMCLWCCQAPGVTCDITHCFSQGLLVFSHYVGCFALVVGVWVCGCRSLGTHRKRNTGCVLHSGQDLSGCTFIPCLRAALHSQSWLWSFLPPRQQSLDIYLDTMRWIMPDFSCKNSWAFLHSLFLTLQHIKVS